MLGRALPFTVDVLFIPVARGSPILRLVDVPFEQAVKYHRWFGYFTVLLVFLHGLTYGVYAGTIHQIELVRAQTNNSYFDFQNAKIPSYDLHVEICVCLICYK